MQARGAPQIQPKRFKKTTLRSRGRAARWVSQETVAATTRRDNLQLRRWHRAQPSAVDQADTPLVDKFSRYDVHPEVPDYDDETYEKHLTNQEWSKEETDCLVDVYRECNGKWPVIIDHYAFSESAGRSVEELKARFYSISATLLQLRTPITSMTAPEYSLFETLSNFNPKQEASRKQLAEGHLFRRQNEVDEESVLLSELQRIMLNQATMETEREVSNPGCLPHCEEGSNVCGRIYGAVWITPRRTRTAINIKPLRHSQGYGSNFSPQIA